MSNVTYRDIVDICYAKICGCVKAKQIDDNILSGLYEALGKALAVEIHKETDERKTEREKRVRDLIAKYVLGYTDSKGVIWYGALPIIENRIRILSKAKKNTDKYYTLYDDFYAIASYRSFKHYCKYMQSVFGANLFIWDADNCWEGYWYYANRMVLDGSVNFIEKQCPTGYGKSLSDAFLQSYIFGVDIDSDILKICGNKEFVGDCFTNVIKLMTSNKYSKVFPYYQKLGGNIFSFCSRTDLKFAINGSAKSTNLRIATKDEPTDGVRAKYLFLDDITRSKDMNNMKAHNDDIQKFTKEWFERNYNRKDFYIVASGTTYSAFDILSHLKRKFNHENSQLSKRNKYTRISNSNFICNNGISCFVCIPLLDYDTDESTFPQKISTEQARAKREENYDVFMAMDMQQPIPPENNPFYYSKLQEYDTLEPMGKGDRPNYHYAYLDGKRKGSDFCAMPILAPMGKTHILTDVFYDNRPMKELYDGLVSTIISKNIIKLYIENNINEGLKKLLSDMLIQRGYMSCNIIEVYNTIKKETRISTQEYDIKNGIIFPKLGTYSQSSPMGKAMTELYGFCYDRKNLHDDFTDALAGYAKQEISKTCKSKARFMTFMR